MGQQNSKANRDVDDSEKEHEKKIEFDIQKLKKKNERKENKSFESKNENKRREKKLYSADQETAQTEKRAETTYPSSARSTEIVAEYRTVDKDKDKTDYDSDEVIDKSADILERTDNGDYVYLHTKQLNRSTYICPSLVDFFPDTTVKENTENHPFGKDSHHLSKNDTKDTLAMKENKKADGLEPKSCKHVEEEDKDPEFIDIQIRLTTVYIRFTGRLDFGTDIGQVQKYGPGSEEKEINVSINNEKYERCKTGNTAYTAGEKLTKLVKSKETHSNEERGKNVQATSSKLGTGKNTFYDLCYKRFSEDVMSAEDFFRLKGNVLCKFTVDCIDHLRDNVFRCLINRPACVYVYAIGFKAGSMLMRMFEDVQFIKYILLRQNMREIYLEDEHFRLATFSLSVNDYEMGEIMRLAGSGFFCDADGSVKCFCCGNTYSPELSNSHHRDCASRSSYGPVGRSIADFYGESATDRLVPSGHNLHEENRTSAFIDIHIRQTTTSHRLGGPQQFTQDDALTQDNEQCHSADEFSVREGGTNARQESSHDKNIDVSVLGNCLRNMDHRNENRKRDSSSREVEDVISLEHAHAHEGVLGEPPTTGRRTIKEDVNREHFKDTAKRCNVVMENERLQSRTMCCKCRNERCNIVFVPCGHLVVCNRCVANTTECPKCGKKVDEGHHVSD